MVVLNHSVPVYKIKFFIHDIKIYIDFYNSKSKCHRCLKEKLFKFIYFMKLLFIIRFSDVQDPT